jgi:hypothetical protein
MKKLLTCLTFIAIMIPINYIQQLQAQDGEVFITWDGFEVDKLGSIWLIERFISPGSSVRVMPKGSPADGGTAFDIPGAAITRTFNRSSYESLVDHYGIKDPGLVGIGMLIHDIEINLWERKVFKKSREIEVFFIDLIQTRMEKNTVIEKSNAYFDALYEILSDDPERNPPS